MIGAFWNIRGMGQTGKSQCLSDFISNNHVDFVCFFETNKENIDSHVNKYISGKEDFAWHNLPEVRTAGGVLVGLKNDLFEVIGFINKKICIVTIV